MSWLALDSKGDLARNYGAIAKNCYGYCNHRNLERVAAFCSDGRTIGNSYLSLFPFRLRNWRLEPQLIFNKESGITFLRAWIRYGENR